MPSFLETSAEIARESGALLSTYFERRVAFELKGEHDLVTEADRASERLVVERLRSHFPSHSIVAEEGGGHIGTSEYCWYVDPLDGTTNFAHGFPMYNVTMALAQAGQLVAGVIFDPTRNEMFASERGAGAYLNNRRIRVSKVSRILDAGYLRDADAAIIQIGARSALAGEHFVPGRIEMFASERGAGAYLNNRRIRVSKVSRIEDALVATGF